MLINHMPPGALARASARAAQKAARQAVRAAHSADCTVASMEDVLHLYRRGRKTPWAIPHWRGAVRYGEDCDGLVCQGDAILPHCPRVVLEDMDHFGPAWPSFPATDRYDPTRLWLVCISMALRYKPLPPPPDQATPRSAAGRGAAAAE